MVKNWARRREMVVTGGVVMGVRTTSSCSSWHEEGGHSTCGKSAYRNCIFQHLRRLDDSRLTTIHDNETKSLSTETLKNAPEHSTR